MCYTKNYRNTQSEMENPMSAPKQITEHDLFTEEQQDQVGDQLAATIERVHAPDPDADPLTSMLDGMLVPRLQHENIRGAAIVVRSLPSRAQLAEMFEEQAGKLDMSTEEKVAQLVQLIADNVGNLPEEAWTEAAERESADAE